MTKSDVLTYIANQNIIGDIIMNICGSIDSDLQDLQQDIFLSLYDKPESLLVQLYDNKQLNYYIAKMLKNNIFSTNSPWYIKYKKSLKFEEVVEYPTLKSLNIKTTYTNLYIITFIITILTMIGCVSEISIYISFILSFIIAIVSIGKIVKIAIS